MISEQQVRWVALFYLFAFLDERAALHAAEKTIASIKTKLRSLPEGSPEIPALIVGACADHYEKSKKHLTRGKLALTFESGWALPDHTELAPWARFHKDASDEELLALIFSRVLGFAETDIALGLGVSEGTARYRIGKAVRHLGAANRLAL